MGASFKEQIRLYKAQQAVKRAAPVLVATQSTPEPPTVDVEVVLEPRVEIQPQQSAKAKAESEFKAKLRALPPAAERKAEFESRIPEYQRVISLPQVNYAGAEWTEALRKPDSTRRLRPIQSQMLEAIKQSNGGIFSVGVGHGKCARKGTEIYDVSEGRRRLIEETGTLTTQSYDMTCGRSVVQPATAFHSGEKPCVRVTLSGGQYIDVSTDHPIATSKGWVAASNISTDMLVAVPRHTPEPAKYLDITNNEVKLLAYLMADGGLTNDAVTFTDNNTHILSEVKELAGMLGEGGGGVRVVPEGNNTERLGLRGLLWFTRKYRIDVLSKVKRLPAECYGLESAQVSLFLNRFWACDGHVNLHTHAVECTLASEGLIDDLRFLLLRVGVISRKMFKVASYTKEGVKHTFDSWRLTIYGREVLNFLDVVGDLFGQEERCRELRRLVSAVKTNTNIDIVPISRAEVTEICDELGYPGRSPRGAGSRTDLRERLGATLGQYVGREKFAAWVKESGYSGKYAWLATSDILWERVKSVEDIGVHEVYDLSVENTHNFVGNCIILHNSLVALLAGRVLQSKLSIIFAPASTLSTLRETLLDWRLHYDVDPMPRIESIESLSQPKSTAYLDYLMRGYQEEDILIVIDECHTCKDPTTSRTGRVLRFAMEHPGVRWVFLSGTITAKSIKDFAHLCAIALKVWSPLPLSKHEVDAWARCIDVGGQPTPTDWLTVRPLWDWAYPGVAMESYRGGARQDMIRDAFQKRFSSAPGVVCSTEGAVRASLVLHGIRLEVPSKIRELLAGVESTGEDPEGEPIPDDADMWRIERELSQGFYYKWDWPKDKDGNIIVDEAWLTARKNWNRFVRSEIKYRAKAGYDSPFLVAAQVQREIVHGSNGPIHRAWKAWDAQRQKDPPPTVPVWISSFLIDHALLWASKQSDPVILWYDSKAVGDALRAKGLPVFGAGQDVPREAITCGMSIHAHGIGKNLQHWVNQLIISPPSGGKTFEQLLGRTHRPRPDGEEVDLVEASIYQHTEAFRDALKKARAKARYIQFVTKNQQKLLYASYDGMDLHDNNEDTISEDDEPEEDVDD